MMYPPEQDDHPNNRNVSSSNGLEPSNLIYTSLSSQNISKAHRTNEKGMEDHSDQQQPSIISSTTSSSITDHEINHPKHFIGMNPHNGNTGVQRRQQRHPPQQCGPHPSQIRVTSPNNSNNNSNVNSSNAPSSSSTSNHSIQPKEVQKPVILCLQSSPLRNKARATTGNGFPFSNHHASNSTMTNDTSNVQIIVPPLRNSTTVITQQQQPPPPRRAMGLPPTPTSPSTSQLLSLPFLYTSPLNSLQQLLSIPSISAPPPPTTTTVMSLQQSQSQSQQQQLRNQDCDYESPTELYQLIEQKQWSRILQKLDEAENDDENDNDEDVTADPNSNNTDTNKNNIRRQASMWMVRKENDGRLLWRILPLHAAIIFRAPHAVIEALLQCDTSSARQKDDRGMLPLHLAMKNFNLQYNQNQNQNHIGSHHPTSTESLPLPLVDTMTTLWRTVEELLTAYPSGIFSRDRKGRTPLQLGLQTVKKTYYKNNNNNNNGSSRSTIALQRQQQEQQRQQEMMLAALSVLERYETIYSTTMGDRNNTTPVTRVPRHPPSSVSPPTSQHSSGSTFPPPSVDEDTGIVEKNEVETGSQNSSTILSIQQQHLETLQTLRSMFQKQRDEDLARYERQQLALQQQLDASLHRERQIQIELEEVKRQLREIQQQQHSNGNHSCHNTESSRESNNKTT